MAKESRNKVIHLLSIAPKSTISGLMEIAILSWNQKTMKSLLQFINFEEISLLEKAFQELIDKCNWTSTSRKIRIKSSSDYLTIGSDNTEEFIEYDLQNFSDSFVRFGNKCGINKLMSFEALTGFRKGIRLRSYQKSHYLLIKLLRENAWTIEISLLQRILGYHLRKEKSSWLLSPENSLEIIYIACIYLQRSGDQKFFSSLCKYSLACFYSDKDYIRKPDHIALDSLSNIIRVLKGTDNATKDSLKILMSAFECYFESFDATKIAYKKKLKLNHYMHGKPDWKSVEKIIENPKILLNLRKLVFKDKTMKFKNFSNEMLSLPDFLFSFIKEKQKGIQEVKAKIEKTLGKKSNAISSLTLFFWRPPNIPHLFGLLRKPSKESLALFVTFAKLIEPHQFIFYMAQFYQVVGEKHITKMLLKKAKEDPITSHQLIWMSRVERGSKVTAPKDPKPQFPKESAYILQKSLSQMTFTEKVYFMEEDGFLNEVTGISGILKPKMEKAEKVKIIQAELKKLKVPSNAYLASDPSYRVVAVIPESGAPMQSHARVPILVAFECIPMENKFSSLDSELNISELNEEEMEIGELNNLNKLSNYFAANSERKLMPSESLVLNSEKRSIQEDCYLFLYLSDKFNSHKGHFQRRRLFYLKILRKRRRP